NNALIGFTTLTHKLGGSVKTGPTVLLPGKRKLGWGSAARRAIAEKAKSEGIRKLYCTCPDWDMSVVSYLLRAGYKIEAHLARHYTPRNGELIFGLQLANHSQAAGTHYRARLEVAAKPIAASNFRKAEVVSAFKNLFSDTWARVSAATASQMIGGYFRPSKRMTYEEKPIALLAIATRK